MSPMKTQDAINYFGGRDLLADALGIDRTATYHWGDYVPNARQYQIELATNGALKASKPANRKLGADATAKEAA